MEGMLETWLRPRAAQYRPPVIRKDVQVFQVLQCALFVFLRIHRFLYGQNAPIPANLGIQPSSVQRKKRPCATASIYSLTTLLSWKTRLNRTSSPTGMAV